MNHLVSGYIRDIPKESTPLTDEQLWGKPRESEEIAKHWCILHRFPANTCPECKKSFDAMAAAFAMFNREQAKHTREEVERMISSGEINRETAERMIRE
jgi:hypothetical protein